MIEPDHRVGFLFKPLQTLGVTREAQWQEFERSLAARCDVGGQIHFTHPAGPDRFGNLVMADRLTDQQVSLAVLGNAHSMSGDWGFDEIPRLLM